MFGGFISWLMENMLYFALHMDGSTVFPKPLSAKDEEEAFRKMAEGDSAARAKLIEHNLRLVAHVVKKYYTTAADSEELISIGTVGLIKAVNTFNKSKSTRFATYAAKCIDNEVLMFFRSAKKSARDVYLDDPVDTDKDGNSMSLMDIISEDDNMVDKIDTMIKTRQLYGFVESCLDEREKQIIRLRYGLYGTVPMTQREVADKLHISRSYVSRIEKKALEKLRDKYEN
ncbi:MAG: RNA polymerase sporulation sigma factor SigK [Ruminococcus sp.]|nr:RNA polymerase sporulation sigma factor SigK [Ruminococcus sp.]